MYVSHRFNHNCPTPKLVSTLAFALRPLPSLVPRLLHCRKTGPGSSLFFYRGGAFVRGYLYQHDIMTLVGLFFIYVLYIA